MKPSVENGQCRWKDYPRICRQCIDGEKFRESIGAPSECPHGKHRMGLGDLVAAVATPIARVLRLPCIDPQTKDLRPESRCAKKKKWLNNL